LDITNALKKREDTLSRDERLDELRREAENREGRTAHNLLFLNCSSRATTSTLSLQDGLMLNSHIKNALLAHRGKSGGHWHWQTARVSDDFLEEPKNRLTESIVVAVCAL